MSEKPSLFGKKWKSEQDEQLLQYINENFTFSEIASKLQRTPGGIKARACMLAYYKYKDGESIENLSILLKITVDELKLYFKNLEYKEEKKNEKKEEKKKEKLENEEKLEKEKLENEENKKEIELKEIKVELKEIKVELKEMRLLMQQILNIKV